MIKALSTARDGRPMVILGLSRVNCERLLANKPIVVESLELGLSDRLTILLLGGETETDIIEDLRAVAPLVDLRPHGRGAP